MLGIKETNNKYGAQNVSTSNIVHFHGKIDPWYPLGKLTTTEEIGDTVIIVEGELSIPFSNFLHLLWIILMIKPHEVCVSLCAFH